MKNDKTTKTKDGDDGKKKRRETLNMSSNTPNQVSKKIGYIVDEFKCSHNNFQGILYVGPLAAVFLGRILLFEWTVVIKWEDVVKVQQCSEKGVENGIRIETQGQNATRYIFERFFDCSKVLGVLISLHNDSILDMTQKAVPTPKVISRGLRRNNSDPLRISNLFNFDDAPVSFQYNEEFNTVMTPNKRKQLTEEEEKTSRISSISAPVRQGGSFAMSAPRNYRRASTCTIDAFSSDTSRTLHFPEGDKVEEREEFATAASKSSVNGKTSAIPLTPQQIQAEWSKVLEESKNLYSEIAVQDLELSCSLDDFIKYFISHEAKSTLTNYMAENGDHNINLSDWKENEEDGGFTKTRTIEYTHPVDAPMAPPTAKARKEQSYRKYGDHGLVLETKTFVSDVPMTDCFYVADLIRVERKNADNGEKKVVVHMLFDIRFVKATMFKSIIQRTTKSELQKFLTSYSQFLSRNLGDVPVVLPQATTAVLASAPLPPPVSNRWSQIAVVILTIVLSLQLWILRDIRFVKTEMKNLVEATVQLQTERIKLYEEAQLHQRRSDERSTDRCGEL